MPWYLWGLIIVIFGSVIGSLLWLKNSANKMPIDRPGNHHEDTY